MCPFDHTHESRVLFHDPVRRDIAVRRCASCGIVFTDPQPTDEELRPYYSEDYGPFQKGSNTKISILKEELIKQFFGYSPRNLLALFLSPLRIPLSYFPSKIENGRLLDIGCGGGNFLALAQKLGWQVYGIDPSPIAITHAKEQGLKNVFVNALCDMKFENNSFDAITLLHVLEHIRDPVATLKEIRRILKPNGFLIISVPNFASLASKIYGKYWNGLSLLLHFFHYTPKTLRQLLETQHFQIEKIYYSDFFEDILGSSLARLVPFLIARPLGILAGTADYAFGNLIAHALRLGSQMIFIARNKFK